MFKSKIVFWIGFEPSVVEGTFGGYKRQVDIVK